MADLTGLPPTLVLNSEYGDLRASGEAFANALAEAGTPVRVRFEPGVTHSHLNTPGLAGTHRSLDVFASGVSHEAFR